MVSFLSSSGAVCCVFLPDTVQPESQETGVLGGYPHTYRSSANHEGIYSPSNRSIHDDVLEK